MHVPATLRTSFGPRQIGLPQGRRVVLTIGELLDLAALRDRQAREAEAEGDFTRADRLAARSAALKESAR